MHTLSAFCASLEKEIAHEALDRAMARIYRYVDTVVTTPQFMPQPIGSACLDALCQEIGAKNLLRFAPAASVFPTQTLHVYLATKLQRSGGHTRVIEQLIAARPHDAHVLLVTERMGHSDRNAIHARFADRKQVEILFCRARSWLGTLSWLQQNIIERQPNSVYVFNHHQDPTIIAAAQPGIAPSMYFYHHGDHHFCLGTTLTHLAHVDLHPMGYYACRRELGLNTHYLPLVVPDQGVRPDTPFMPKGVLTTATSARSHKLTPPYFIHYDTVIPQLLKETKGRHVHIGQLNRRLLSRIRKGLSALGVSPEQFVYIPYVPSVWQSLIEQHVDLYIASFPIGGGLTMVEAIGAGIPVALHDHVTSSLVRSAEMVYPGAFHWRMPHQLYSYCLKLTPAFLKDLSRRARTHYLEHHQPALLDAALHEGRSIAPAPDQYASFTPMPEAWPHWHQDLHGPRQQLKTLAYRHARRIRAVIDKYR